MLTERQIKQNNHIPSEIIKKDIIDTQFEIDNLKAQLEMLNKNRADNRLKIYMCEGNILTRETFIVKLSSILNYRKEPFKLENHEFDKQTISN